ncbi:MAG: hypothetical protein ACUVS3_16415 [Thermodesulfobacteriota bacterium]
MLEGAGYTVKDACEALGVSRSGYYGSFRVKEVWCAREGISRDGDLLEKIEAIEGDIPFGGIGW